MTSQFKRGWATGVLLMFGALSASVTVSIPWHDVQVGRDGQYAGFVGTDIYGDPGQPALPVYFCSVLLPPDADLGTVTLTISGLKEKVVGSYLIRPALPPASINGYCWPGNRSIVDGKDIDIYSSNVAYPASHIAVTNLGQLHCYKLVDVRVNLARYNPVTKDLLEITDGKLVVDFKKQSSYSRAASHSVIVPLGNKRRIQARVVNYNEFGSMYDNDFTFVKRGKLAIMTTAAIQSGSKKFAAFIASKVARKIDVKVVTDWGTDATALRTWLQNNYTSMGIEDVLLIGNSSGDVPMMTFTGYASSSNCNSDWPYSQLTGDYKADKTCEVNVGRFPVYSNNIDTLDIIMQKVIDYESAGPEALVWRKAALLGAGGYDSGAKGDALLNAIHKNIIVTNTPWKDFRVYGTAYGTPTVDPTENTKVGISESIFTAEWTKLKPGVVSWGTHGSSSSAQYVFSSTYTKQVGNANPAFVLCGSCSNASISTSGNLSYSILKNCGMGAIGGTNLTYYNSGVSSFDNKGCDQGWAYNFVKFHVRDTMEAGDVVTALREMDPNYGWYNRGPYVLYGDPTVGVFTYGTDITANEFSTNAPEGFALSYANAQLVYRIPQSADKRQLSISLYSPQGKLVRTLINGVAEAGNHTVSLKQNNDSKLASGLYLCRMEAGEYTRTLNFFVSR